MGRKDGEMGRQGFCSGLLIMKVRLIAAIVASAGLVVAAAGPQPPQEPARPPGLIFSSGVELINVTATVYDDERTLRRRPHAGRLRRLRRRCPPGRHALQQRARAGQPRHRRSTRAAAWPARRSTPPKARSTGSSTTCSVRTTRSSSIGFSDEPRLLQNWTSDRRAAQPRPRAHHADRRHGALRRGRRGRAARAMQGQHQKKALVVISDGNDTSSPTTVSDAEASRSARAKCWSTPSGSTARARTPAHAGAAPPPRDPEPPRTPVPLPFPGGGRLPPRLQRRRPAAAGRAGAAERASA